MEDINKADLVVVGIGQAYTARPATSEEYSDPSLELSTFKPELIADATVACGNGRILYVGGEEGLEEVDTAEALIVDAEGRLVTPGLIDCHTHLVFDGSRHDEYAMRCMGSSYPEIAAAGGGILSTVRKFREAGEDLLFDSAQARTAAMAFTGTTTVEIKSGYGLSTEEELRALSVIGRLADEEPLRVVPTFMGAHEVPDEYRSDRAGYVDLVVEEMIPAASEQGIARFCDVFCEKGVFDVEESERILRAGIEHGLGAKIHSDEFEVLGGTEMAVSVGAVSAEHLTALTDSGLEALASSATTAVLLPGTTLFLGKDDYAPARALLDRGAQVALATDFNPGSSTFLSLPLITTIACSQMGMHPAEALQGVTINAAKAVGLEKEVGRLEVGYAADLVIWDADDYRMIPYAAGHPLVLFVVIEGEIVTFD